PAIVRREAAPCSYPGSVTAPHGNETYRAGQSGRRPRAQPYDWMRNRTNPRLCRGPAQFGAVAAATQKCQFRPTRPIWSITAMFLLVKPGMVGSKLKSFFP